MRSRSSQIQAKTDTKDWWIMQLLTQWDEKFQNLMDNTKSKQWDEIIDLNLVPIWICLFLSRIIPSNSIEQSKI